MGAVAWVRAAAVAAALFAAAALTACDDLREYTGPWTGDISVDPHLNQGFPAGTTISAEVASANRASIALHLTITRNGQTPAPAPFQPIARASGDILADTQLPGEPLRTYFGFTELPGEPAFLTVVSLYPENRMELRLIRGPNDAYGVFYLRRVPSPGQPAPSR